MASISVQEWGYINTNMGKFSTGSASYLVLAKHSDGGEWTSFLGAHFYWVATGGYLDRSGTVKCSHKWLVRSSWPWNPGKEAISRKKVSLHESFFFFFFQSSRLLFHSYMLEWWWSSVFLSPPRLLRRSLSDHLDAVLLELRSEQSVFVLQFFNLHNRTKKKQ